MADGGRRAVLAAGCGAAMAATSACWPAWAVAEPASAGRAAHLLAEHTRWQAALRDSPFGEPLLLDWREGDGQDEATVRAELPRPLARLAELFGSAASVCEMLFLHMNVRACQAGSDSSGATLAVSAGPMRERMPGLVYGLDLQLRSEGLSGSYLDTHFSAADGPLGVHGIAMRLEAVPLAPERCYLHLHYTHDTSRTARVATSLYLATAGRSKAGFTRIEPGPDGSPRYIGGQRAAMERNVMRHYLALLTSTTAVTAGTTPAARLQARLLAWHGLTERHALQLHEMDLADYLAEKHGALARAARRSPSATP